MKKNKGLIITIVVIVLVALWGILSYNGLVGMDENVSNQWANVETQYQRRSDLIPNLVNTVKGYAKHEEKVFTEVTEARTKIGQININAENMTDEQIEKFQKAQEQMSGALSKLMAVSEAYPELKANENFRDLQAQLEGTENRINESRQLYNKAVKDFNVKVRRFPSNIIAGICGFEKKSPFEADAKASEVPSVNF